MVLSRVRVVAPEEPDQQGVSQGDFRALKVEWTESGNPQMQHVDEGKPTGATELAEWPGVGVGEVKLALSG